MPRTLGQLSRDGETLTGYLPVRCRTELGMFTGHVEIPEGLDVDVKNGPFLLRLKDNREIAISFSGSCGLLAYFHSVSSDVGLQDPVLV